MIPMSQSSGSSSRASLASRRALEDESRGRSTIPGRSRAGASARRASSSSGDTGNGNHQQHFVKNHREVDSTALVLTLDPVQGEAHPHEVHLQVSTTGNQQLPAESRVVTPNQDQILHYFKRRSSTASNRSNSFSGPAVDMPPRHSSVRKVELDPQLFPGTGWTPEFDNKAWEDWKPDSALLAQRADYKAKDDAATKGAKSHRDDFVDASSVSSSAGLGKSASTDLSASSLDRGALRPLPRRNMDVRQHKSTS